MKTVVFDYQIFGQQEFGGISRYFCEIASRMQKRMDWHARVVAPLYYNRYLVESEISKFGVFVPMISSRQRRMYTLTNRLLSRTLMRFGSRDVVHQTYYWAKPRTATCPVVITVYDMIHELFPEHFRSDDPTRRRKRASVNSADHVICISNQTANDLMTLLDVPREKITVTHLGYSQVFDRCKRPLGGSGIDSHRPYFLYVGERAGYKNFARLLEAFATERQLHRDFDLYLFGGPPITNEEGLLIRKYGIREGAVRKVGGSDEALAGYYSRATAFVYPSEYEGFGIPPLEAMASACPVVCSNSSSIPEVVGDAGIYFDPRNIESMRDALCRVAGDSNCRSGLIAAGLRRSARFSWDKCVNETIAAYGLLV